MKKMFFLGAITWAMTYNTAFGAFISRWGATCIPTGVPTDIRQAIVNITNFILGFVAMISILVVVYGFATEKKIVKYGFYVLIVCALTFVGYSRFGGYFVLITEILRFLNSK